VAYPLDACGQILETREQTEDRMEEGPQAQKRERRRKAGEERGGEMSRVRIYDLTKELKPETKKSLKIAQHMGITGPLNVAGRRRKPPTKKPKK